MIFTDEHKRSLLPKLFFMAALLFVILACSLLMFADVKNISSLLEPYEIRGDIIHRIILLTCLIVYFARLALTAFVFLKRTLGWGETLVISLLMSFALFSFVREGGSNTQSIGFVEIAGIILYISGSFINTHSEYTRYIWKKDPNNKGRIYTEGLFRYSMHINYFGDCLLFTGFALAAHSFTLLVVPFFMTAIFIFFIIPRLDKYLLKKYGKEFIDYAERTKKLIPKIY